MTVLRVKSGAGGTWEEVGGIGVGVPAGGTTGQVLVKTSAADYATAWGSNQPILANTSYLQGYRADGTTPQNLIGMTPTNYVGLGGDTELPNNRHLFGANTDGTRVMLAGVLTDNSTVIAGNAKGTVQIAANSLGDIYLGGSLAAGKNLYVPRLTVQGILALASDQLVTSADGGQVIMPGAGGIHFGINRNVYFNYDAGNATFYRDVSVSGTLYKAGVAYTHPDFVLESWATGRIETFRAAPGARDYVGLQPLATVEEYIRQNWRLPGHVRDGTTDVFRQNDETLASVEEAFLYLIDHAHRLKALEAILKRDEV